MGRLSIVASFSCLALGLSGCFTPSPLSVATMMFGAHSYAVSGKTLTDHGISGVTGEDCALTRLISEGDMCRDEVVYAPAPDILEPLPLNAGGVPAQTARSGADPISGSYLKSAPLSSADGSVFSASASGTPEQVATTGFLASTLDQL